MKPKRVKLSAADLNFISENQKLAGFSGRITKETARHQPDIVEIARATAHLDAQIPSVDSTDQHPNVVPRTQS